MAWSLAKMAGYISRRSNAVPLRVPRDSHLPVTLPGRCYSCVWHNALRYQVVGGVQRRVDHLLGSRQSQTKIKGGVEAVKNCSRVLHGDMAGCPFRYGKEQNRCKRAKARDLIRGRCTRCATCPSRRYVTFAVRIQAGTFSAFLPVLPGQSVC